MKMCNNCKRVVDDNQKFCQFCGKNSFENITFHSEDEIKQEAEQKKAEKQAKKKRILKKIKKIVIAWIAINIIVYVITLIAFVIDDNKESKNSNEISVTESTAAIELATFSDNFEIENE